MTGILRFVAAAAFALAALAGTAAPVAAAIQTFEANYMVPGGSAPGQSGFDSFNSPPLVLASRSTLTASLTPADFGAAFQNLSFSLTSASGNFLSWSGTGSWTGTVDLDAGTYFAVASGRTVASNSEFQPSGYFGIALQFVTADPTVIPIPAAAGLFAGGVALLGLVGRRRRAAAAAPAITV